MAHIWKGFLRTFSILGLASFFLVYGLIASQADSENKEFAVVELFTSQGCSSCPPADAYLGKLIERPGGIGLTLPVDYWDYLGWKDTLANRQYSNRQRTYAISRGDSGIYTPQMVVNGLKHVVGSRYTRVDAAIARAKKVSKKHAVSIVVQKENDTIWVKAGDANENSGVKSGTIWLACVTKSVTVSIGRGENTGRTITYYNVVRRLIPVGQWMGKSMTLRLPKQEFVRDNPDRFVAFLQASGNKQIIGVAQISNK